MDVKAIVQQGYDRVAADYLEWTTSKSTPRLEFLKKILDLLPEGGKALEVGCGAGVPCTQMLSQRANTTAVDISAEQVALAKENVRDAEVVQADIMTLDYCNCAFDAIVSMYTLFHLPREEQGVLFQRFASWLREGGYLLINLGTSGFAESIDPSWLGARMYWSSYDSTKNMDLLRGAGFEILEWKIIEDDEDNQRKVPFLWILASKSKVAIP